MAMSKTIKQFQSCQHICEALLFLLSESWLSNTAIGFILPFHGLCKIIGVRHIAVFMANIQITNPN